MNVQNMQATLDRITSDKKQWKQHSFVCGVKVKNECKTAFCFAGHAAALAGHKIPKKVQSYLEKEANKDFDAITDAEYDAFCDYEYKIQYKAQEFLDLSDKEVGWLFDGDRTIADFKKAIKTAKTTLDPDLVGSGS